MKGNQQRYVFLLRCWQDGQQVVHLGLSYSCQGNGNNDGKKRNRRAENDSRDHGNGDRQNSIPVEFLYRKIGQPPRKYPRKDYAHALTAERDTHRGHSLSLAGTVEREHLRQNGENRKDEE